MSRLRFTDGVTIDTDGPHRVVRKPDGLYVVGRGMCCPVASRAEGDALVARLQKRDAARAVELMADAFER